MFRHDDDVNDFNTEGSLKYKTPTEINETYVRVNRISRELIKELNTYLKSEWDERGEYAPTADVVKRDGGDAIYFDITWGDWKHDHIRLWYLVNQFFGDRGYHVERDVVVTETDGSDTYSAEHYFTPYGDDEKTDVKAMHEGYVSKECSYAMASEIALKAKRALKLPAHEVEMLEHDINNLRADEWVDSFSKLSDKSPVKQLFFKYAVAQDDTMDEGWLEDVKADKIKRIETNAEKASNAMGNLLGSLTDDTKEAWGEQIKAEDIEAMKYAADAAWLLYHYRKDGKVRPIKKR
jgi:hypothetical protein